MSTKTSSNTAPQLQEELALALLLEQTVRSFYPDRGPDEMHPGQWAALRYLGRANADARTIAGLGRYLGITVGPASRAVAALERKRLIAVTVDPDDKRARRLALTPEGQRLLEADPLRQAAQRIGTLQAAARAGLRAAVLVLLGETDQDRAGQFVLEEQSKT